MCCHFFLMLNDLILTVRMYHNLSTSLFCSKFLKWSSCYKRPRSHFSVEDMFSIQLSKYQRTKLSIACGVQWLYFRATVVKGQNTLTEESK